MVGIVNHFHAVAALGQALHGALGHRGFYVDLQARVVAPAWRIAGGLRVLPIVQHAHQGLHMALGLHVGPHHAVAHHRLAIFAEERGDDGVEGALARCHQVGRVVALGVQAKGVPPVLQTDAERGLHAAGAKAHVVALDEADHHAVFVRCAQVNRAAFDRVARAEVLRFFHVDQLGAAGQIGVVQHLLHRHFHRRWLGHITVHIGKGQLHRLDLQVLGIHAVHGHARHIKFIQNTQRNQGRNALAVGWNLMQGVAPVIFANRRDPLGLVRGKVAGLQAAAVFGGEAFNRLRNLAAVEGLALGLCNRSQAARRRLELKQFAHIGRSAPG